MLRKMGWTTMAFAAFALALTLAGQNAQSQGFPGGPGGGPPPVWADQEVLA